MQRDNDRLEEDKAEYNLLPHDSYLLFLFCLLDKINNI